MEKDKEKTLNNFTSKIIKEAGFDMPSHNFTETVLAKLEKKASKDKPMVYAPLIPSFVWWVFGCLTLAIFAYVLIANVGFESSWLAASRLNNLASFNLFGKPLATEIPNMYVYGSVVLALLVLIQISLLKMYFNKSYIRY